MDSFEVSKIAGAVLCAVLVIVLPRTLAEMSAEGAEHAKSRVQAGYDLPMPDAPGKVAAGAKAVGGAPLPLASGAPAAGAAPETSIYDKVKPLLASAHPDGGAGTFKICSACHSGEKGGAAKVGPPLWGVVGRKTGSIEGFNYSEGMKGKGGEWTYDRLAAFISGPKAYVTGTKMQYAGLQDPEKLADLLAYLSTLSDAPVPLPK